jgi:hypothetical protein
MFISGQGRFTELQVLDCLSMEVGKTNREIRKEMKLSPGSEMILREYINLFVNHGFARQRVRPTTLEERKKTNSYKLTEVLITEAGVRKRKELQQKPPQRRIPWRMPCG